MRPPFGPLKALLLFVWALLACRSREVSAEGTRTVRPTLECGPALPARMQRGMCYAHSYEHGGAHGYASQESARSRRELKQLGVSWLSVTPFGFSRSLADTQVQGIGDYPAGESDARVRGEIAAAHKDGFRVLLKPHVWIGSGQWIGHVHFTDAARKLAWHESYEAWLLHYAQLAEDEHVAILSIGTELGRTEENAQAWRDTIARVRAVFHGKLTFGANWTEVERVPFWDALDYVGVQFYAPLESKQGPRDEASRRRALTGYLDAYDRVAQRVSRPILFTEVGYRAMPETNVAPHAWPEHVRSEADEAAQAQAYRRFFEAIAPRENVHGVYLWKWFTHRDSPEEGKDGFSPRGKLAARVVSGAYAGRCR